MPAQPANADTGTINVAILGTHKAEGEHAVKSAVESYINTPITAL